MQGPPPIYLPRSSMAFSDRSITDSGRDGLVCSDCENRCRNSLMNSHKYITTSHLHTHPFNGPLSGTTQVSRYQKGTVQPIWILLRQETVSGTGISWAICKSAPCSRQITMPAPHRSVTYNKTNISSTLPSTKRNQFSSVCILFSSWQKLANFFTYIWPKKSIHISYNSVYLILAVMRILQRQWH